MQVELTGKLKPSASIVVTLVSCGLLSGVLLLTQRNDYSFMHIMLDTCMFLLPGLLAMLFWEMGLQIDRVFPRLLAICFAVTCVLALLHVLVGVEWPAAFASFNEAKERFRPTTWPPPRHLLSIGIMCAIWLALKKTERTWPFAIAMVFLAVALIVVFRWLPLYTAPTLLGVTRPALIASPLLWAFLGLISWRVRATDRLLPSIAFMAFVFVIADVAMLYSLSSHGTMAIVAHLGVFTGYMVLVLSVMQMASSDMRGRIRAEQDLVQLNQQLESRVTDRTILLRTTNEALTDEIAGHRQTESAFRESEARLSGIVGSAMDAIISVNSKQQIVLFNAAAEKMFRCSAADAMGQSLARFIPERFREQHHGHVEWFGKTGVTSRSMRSLGTLSGLRTDGEEFPIEASISQVEIDDEKIFTVILRDVTERNRSEEKFRLAVESAPNAVVISDRKGRIMLVNEQAEKLFGYTRAELLVQSMEVLVPERFRDRHPGYRREFHTNPAVRSMGVGRDLNARRKDGSEFPVEIGLTPIHTDEGLLVLSTIVDISERRRAEKKFQLAVESAPNGVVMVNSEGRIVLVNVQTEKLFGYERAELLGQSVEILVPERYRGHHPTYRDTFIRNPVVRSMGAGRDLYGLRKDGSEFPVEIGLTPIQTEEENLVLSAIVDITERKRAESALRASEERLRIVTDNARVGLVMVNSERCYTFANATYAEMLGLPSSDLVGQRVADVLAPLYEEQIRPRLDRAFAGERVAYELHKPSPDEDRFFTVSYEPTTVDGVMSLVVVVITDITERKQAEAARQASEARYGTLFECAPDGIVVANSKSVYLDVNTSMCQMLGYTRDEFIGLHASDIVAPSETQHNGSALKAIKAKSDSHRERQFLRKDGSVFPAEVIETMMPDGNLMGMIRDITERNRGENAVRQSEDRLDFALKVSKTGAWDLDLLDHSAYRSLQHDRIFGYETGLTTWTYEVFLEHVLPEDRQEVDDLFSRAIENKGDWSFECRVRRFDGEFRWIWASGRHRFDEAGVPRRMSGIVQDITERKQAELEILKLNEELEQRVAERTAQLQAVNKELEAFSYSVSHDLRAPLRHINGFSQALLEDYEDKLDDAGRSFLREVRGATHEMAQLIDDVLQLARVTRSEMRRENVNVSDLADSVVADLQTRDPERNVSVHIEGGLFAHGDKRLLRIVLDNLLANAWKFTSKREQPEITFGHEQKDGQVVYVVRDNGAGFDMTFANKLFGAFQRLHTASEFEGTGIGLATVQRIVNRHGGRVWADGAVDAGATFSFTLP